MPDLSNQGTRLILDHFLGVTEHVFPTELWLGLSDSPPEPDGSDLYEVACPRVNVLGAFGAATGIGVAANTSTIAVTDVPAGTISHGFLTTSEAATDYLWRVQLYDAGFATPTPIVLVAFTPVLEFAPGSLVIQGTA
jgi:hypothetical protein